MSGDAKRLPFPLVAAAGLLLLALAGCGGSGDAGPPAGAALRIEGLFPAFDRSETRYVSRCGRGASPIQAEAGDGVEVKVGSASPRSGSFRIDPGAPPGADFPIAVVEGGRRDAYRVRCLPADFPAWRFEALRPAPPGLFVVSFRAARDARPWVIVFDQEGVPRWWYSPDTRALWAQILADGTISWARSFGDGYGLDPRMAHEVRSPSGRLLRLVRTEGSIVDGHEFRELGDGNVLVDTYVPETADLRRVGGPRRAAIVSAEIQELDPRGHVLWRWSSRGHIGLGETGRWWRSVLSNPRRRLQGRATYDPVHVNSIEPRGRDEVVISTRHTDAVYGIRRSTGEILWKLGGSRTGKSLRVIGDPARKLLGGQHDARIGADGRLSVYDNGKDRPRRPRVAFYRLDPERGRARYIGQLNDPEVTASHCCGSARQLPGGGWLVSWGDNPLVTAFDEQGRVVFRLELAASTFRAVPAPPGATTPAALDRGLEAMEHRAPAPGG
jgi:Arylsulfotransferase (ASST)